MQNLADMQASLGADREAFEAALLARAKKLAAESPTGLSLRDHLDIHAALGTPIALTDESLTTHWAKRVLETTDPEVAKAYLFDAHGRARS